MKITIETIPHVRQRYNTVGDWHYDEDGNIKIKVSQMETKESEYLVIIHELIEAILCRDRFITVEQVDEWDISHPEAEEPGDLVDSPYYLQHNLAEMTERLIAQQLQISWAEHCKIVKEASVDKP